MKLKNFKFDCKIEFTFILINKRRVEKEKRKWF